VPGRPSPATECDLVMKGGVTSGVVYPAAVLALKDRYRFVNIGGASAGAIAAAATAAAEYGRDDARPAADGFARLGEVRAELQQPGLLPRLFQPTKETRPAVDLLLAVQQGGSTAAKIRIALRRLVLRLWLPVTLQVAAVFCVLALAIGHAGGTWASLGVGGWLAVAAVLVASAVLGFGLTLAHRAIRIATVHLPVSYFGACLGKAEGRSTGPALTEWLHEKVQHIAGVRTPLTFADLAARGVHLRMMTTDLARARPLRLPDGGGDYWYAPVEFAVLFPPDVVAHLCALPGEVRPAAGAVPELRRFPDGELPVLVATRMSLSFPGLLSAVPLWTVFDGKPVRHWISDGGISSNFPVHLFDAWVPGRPTFGLNLVPAQRVEHPATSAEDAVERRVGRPAPVRRAEIRGSVGFFSQILDTMQNWRDTLQSELPQFSDRIADIELADNEGGMNISMPQDVVRAIDRKGTAAGEELAGFDWPSHKLRRYVSFMRSLQTGLRSATNGGPPGVGDGFDPEYAEWLADGGRGVEPPLDVDPKWFPLASAATVRLLADAESWLDAESGLSFAVGPEELPRSVMRITPDV
jgi:predicted acylesterase/phospholipase RssA